MLREHSKLAAQLHHLLDVALTALAFGAAFIIKLYLLPAQFAGLASEPPYLGVFLLIILIWYVVFSYFNLYQSYRPRRLREVLWQMVKAVSVGLIILFLCLYVFKIADISRILIGIFYFLDILFLALSKSVVYYTLRKYRGKGFNFRNVLIVGSRTRAQILIENILKDNESGYRIVGCLEINEDDIGKEVSKGFKIIGSLGQIKNILLTNVIDEVIFAIPLRDILDPRPYIGIAEEIGVNITFITDLYIDRMTYRPVQDRIQLQPFFGLHAVTLSSFVPDNEARFIKSAMDYVLSAILLIIVAPIFLILAIAIKLSSMGPVFFKQERIGLNGRPFMLYKFRTMVSNAPELQKELEALNEASGPAFKIKKDPRIIPVLGHFLRKMSLDELPQLINVIRGEMSLVGPRPPIQSEVEKYLPWQRRRLSMKPGLTCIWQTTPHRNDVSFDDWMMLDLQYIDSWSLMLDFVLLFKTAKVVLLGHGR